VVSADRAPERLTTGQRIRVYGIQGLVKIIKTPVEIAEEIFLDRDHGFVHISDRLGFKTTASGSE
jgi:hypothetical protein